MPELLLLHSPLVGPGAFRPLAVALAEAGHNASVPDLRPALESGPPFWQSWARLAATASSEGDVVLCGHSGAGRLLPAVARAMTRTPAGYLFIDAGLPYNGESQLTRASAAFREGISSRVEPDGRLPRWTDWWPEGVLTSLLPDAVQRASLAAECPRVHASLLEEPVPVQQDWPDAPCAFLSFTYEEDAREAEARDWPVVRLDGSHLLLVTDPAAVCAAIRELLDQAGIVLS